GDDIIAACRTAYDDGKGGAHSAHDANYLTFHRFANFRTLNNLELPMMRAEAAGFQVTGANCTIANLADADPPFRNRDYVWQGVPEKFKPLANITERLPYYKYWRITQTRGGEKATIRVKATANATVYIMAGIKQPLEGWQAVPAEGFHYTDNDKTPVG